MEMPNQLDFLETKTSISTNNTLSQKTNTSQNSDSPEASFKDTLNASLIQNKEMNSQSKEFDKLNLLNQSQLFGLTMEEENVTDFPKKIKKEGINQDELKQSNSDEASLNQDSIFNFMEIAPSISAKLPIETSFNASSQLKTQMESEIKKANQNIENDKQVNILADLKLTDLDQKKQIQIQNHPGLEAPLFDIKLIEKNQQPSAEFNIKKTDGGFSLNDKEKVFSEVSNVTNSVLQQALQKLNLSTPEIDPSHEILTKDKVPFSPTTEAQTLVTSIQEGDSVLHTAFLKIYPPELGPVIAKIKMNSNNEAELSLLTSNAQTRDVLVANIQNIKENFSESDMMLHKVHVEYHSDLLQQGSTSNSKDEQRERFFQAKFDPNLFEDSAKKAKIKSTSNTSVIDAYI